MTPMLAALCGACLLALLESPLFVVLGGLAVAGLYAIEGDWHAIQVVLIEINRMASMPILTALPLFTFAGCLLTETRAPYRILDFLDALTEWMPGGLGIAGLCACAFFTALTGASGVTIMALGGVLYPMLKTRYAAENFNLGLLTTAGGLGLLFPPSLPVILYGVVAQVDIAVLFKAALLPGILLLVALAIYVMARAHILDNAGDSSKRLSARHRASWHRVRRAFVAGIWEWPVALIILVGVYGGYVTISEVSVLVVVYLVVVECLIRKEVDMLRRLPVVIVESTVLSGAILVILGMSLGLTGYLVDQQIPGRILEALSGLTDNRVIFLAGLNLFLLAVGCIMDIFSAVVIVAPVMVPVAVAYGIDPIHLGVIFLVNLEIGYSTPPVGMNLFIASLKFRRPLTLLYRASLPYLMILLLVLLLITYWPQISIRHPL